MRIRINLTYPTADVPVNNQHFMNGFIFESFGKDCDLHDTFSDYNISSLQGGTLKNDKKHIEFKNGNPYFYISGSDSFVNFAIEAFENSTASVFGMRYDSIGIDEDFVVNTYFDSIVTISPIIVKAKNGRKITFKDDEWLDRLTQNCVNKLQHLNIVDPTFKLEVVNPHKAKEKCVWVGDIFNVCSNVRLKVFGRPGTRKALYNLGLGGSTGSGFGSIKIYTTN
jgi:CRISPR-associated endoribonuclease Cas6